VGLEDFSDDFLTQEAGIAAAATALLLSPPVRAVVRRAAVAGLAGLLAAGDSIAGLLPGRAERQAARSPAVPAFVRTLAEEAREERTRRGKVTREAVAAGGEDAGASRAQP